MRDTFTRRFHVGRLEINVWRSYWWKHQGIHFIWRSK